MRCVAPPVFTVILPGHAQSAPRANPSALGVFPATIANAPTPARKTAFRALTYANLTTASQKFALGKDVHLANRAEPTEAASNSSIQALRAAISGVALSHSRGRQLCNLRPLARISCTCNHCLVKQNQMPTFIRQHCTGVKGLVALGNQVTCKALPSPLPIRCGCARVTPPPHNLAGAHDNQSLIHYDQT